MSISAQNNKLFKQRRSQAAMEFLMTYGWAILVVLAAIAALAYFGVLSPEKFLGEQCIVEPGLACTSSKVEPAKITLVLAQNKGKTITIDSIAVGSCSGTFSKTMISGTSETFVIGGSCSNGEVKERYKGEIVIGYTEKESNLTRTARGNLNINIE